MKKENTKKFDNVLVRTRDGACMIASVLPPFITGYWPSFEQLAGEVGLREPVEVSSTNRVGVAKFLSALSRRDSKLRLFKPDRTGFKPPVREVQSRENYRAAHCWMTIVGNCSRPILLGAAEIASQRLKEGGAVHLCIKEWDPLQNWIIDKWRLQDVVSYLYRTKDLKCSMMFYSRLKTNSNWDSLWEFIYNYPIVRLAWQANDFAACGSVQEFEEYCSKSESLTNLSMIAERGIWPHISLPVTALNVKIIPHMLIALAKASRGASIEVIPELFLTQRPQYAAPPVADYVAALLEIYKDDRIPLRIIEPQSWVASRIDANAPLVTSPEAAGASLVILESGDIYPAESAIGNTKWRMGNVRDGYDGIQWEKLDTIAEMYGQTMKPAECQACDWRYRCGGIDTSLLLGRDESRANTTWQHGCDLYCASRKALFEQQLWDVTLAAAENNVKRERETVKLCGNGISYAPAETHHSSYAKG